MEASRSSDLGPFLSLLEDCIEESCEEYEKAAEEQRAGQEWARSIASKFDARAKVRAENEYEVWKNAVELLAAHVRDTIEIVDETAQFGHVYYKDFGIVEFEKYVSLKSYETTKRTWFFRVDFVVERKSDRYLFFFGSPSYDMRQKSPVGLFIARETPAGSFHYEKLDFITAPDVPAMVEIGYNVDEGQFFISDKGWAHLANWRRDDWTKVCSRGRREAIWRIKPKFDFYSIKHPPSALRVNVIARLDPAIHAARQH